MDVVSLKIYFKVASVALDDVDSGIRILNDIRGRGLVSPDDLLIEWLHELMEVFVGAQEHVHSVLVEEVIEDAVHLWVVYAVISHAVNAYVS
jgi:hypothetical protein